MSMVHEASTSQGVMVANQDLTMSKHRGEDMSFWPANAVDATFRIENVAVKVTHPGSPEKERVVEGMGVKLGKAAREHVRQLRGNLNMDHTRSSMGLELPDNRSSSVRRSSDEDNSTTSSATTTEAEFPDSPSSKRMIIPKFISSDPAYYSGLCGLQETQAQQGNPQVSPFPPVETAAIRPVLEHRDTGIEASFMYGMQDASQNLAALENRLLTVAQRGYAAGSADDSYSMTGSESPSVDALRQELKEIDVASRTEVEGLKGEVNGMRNDLDRMFGMLAKIHRKMTSRDDDKGEKDGGQTTSGGMALNLKKGMGKDGKEKGSTRTQQVLRQFSQKASWSVEGVEVDFGSSRRCVGEGTISHVFKASYRGREVAVKMLRLEGQAAHELPDFAVDLGNELSCVSMRFSHPNIIQFVGAGTTSQDGRVLPMILYEYVAGGSILDVMQAKSDEAGEAWVPPRAVSLSWCQQLLQALAVLHTHEKPLAHRDVKPANLLLSEDLSTLKLADFSLATPLSGKASDTYFVAGSMRYMAPEVSATVPFDLEKADMYSAALTCWCIIYGARPYEDIEDSQKVLMLAGQGHRPAVPDKDAELGSMLAQAWDPHPPARARAEYLAKGFSELLAKEKTWGKKMMSKLSRLGSFGKKAPPRSGSVSPTSSASSTHGSPLLT